MPLTIVIHTKEDGNFLSDARTILEGSKCSEIRVGTFIGNGSPTPIVQQLKNLDSYKEEKTKHAIKIYHGSLSAS